MTSNLWPGNHVCCFVTGASRGLGKAITLGLAKHFVESLRETGDSTDRSLSFVLTSRNVEALQGVVQEVTSLDTRIKVVDVIQGSLDDPQTIASFSKTCLAIGNSDQFDEAVLVHNAGSLGDVELLTNQFDMSSTSLLYEYFEVNLFSVVKMTGIFLQQLASIQHRFIINISSLIALVPFKGLALYSTGKAARDAFFRTVAEEHPEVLVLNYAPGPLKTDMVEELKTRGHLQEMFRSMEVLSPDDSVDRLISVLATKQFKSGAHVDYFD